jgi:hypothetical protein
MAILVPIWGSILVPVWSCSVMPVWWRLVRLFGGARPPSPPASPTSSSGSSAIDTQRFLIVLGAPSVGCHGSKALPITSRTRATDRRMPL